MDPVEVERLVLKPTMRRSLGKYVLLGRIGHGGMGKIYLAFAPGPGGVEKLLVIKRLHGHLAGDPVLVSSFLDEARLSMALSHPNIVNTYDVGLVQGRSFMVMEHVDGQNLGVLLRWAKRSGDYPPSALWGGLFVPVLDALHAAHTARDARGRELRVIHRDVSPQNVLVTYAGVPKLVDFGIAKATLQLAHTDAGVLKGKYSYMSPEQVRGEPLDGRSDVFAAGVVLWEALAGRRLYKSDTIHRSIERILDEAPILPTRVNPDCDPVIAEVVVKALQKDRAQRFSSAATFRDALDDAVRASSTRFRPADTAVLMERLFHDVIARQRAVLDACLAGATAAADDDDDDDASDGAVDVDPDRESTTPSVARASPLITGDEERADDEADPILGARASAARRTTSSRRPRSASRSSAAARSRGPQPSSPVPAPSPDRPGTPETAAALTAATLEDGRRSSRLPLVAGVLTGFLLLAGAGAAAFVLIPAELRRDTVVDATTAPAGPATGVDGAGTTGDGAKTGDAATTGDGATAGDGVPQVGAPTVDPGTTTGAAPPRAPARPTTTTTPRADPPRRDRAPSPPRPAEVVPVEPAPPTEPVGYLTLDTSPWTTVWLGKKKIGDTPLVRVAVPAGTLELVLENKAAGIEEGYVAKVKTGQEFKMRLDLR